MTFDLDLWRSRSSCWISNKRLELDLYIDESFMSVLFLVSEIIANDHIRYGDLEQRSWRDYRKSERMVWRYWLQYVTLQLWWNNTKKRLRYRSFTSLLCRQCILWIVGSQDFCPRWPLTLTFWPWPERSRSYFINSLQTTERIWHPKTTLFMCNLFWNCRAPD